MHGHDHGSMTMTTATTRAMATGRPMAGMGGHGGHGGHGGGSGCKISMLFNLNTIDSCFLSRQWKITSIGMFAGSCIGVFFLGVLLELLRRGVKEYDGYIVRAHVAKYANAAPGAPQPGAEGGSVSSTKDATPAAAAPVVPPFRPSVLQQLCRAVLHLLQFFVAYILMLLAMYYNGYLLLCIFLGVFVGAFAFQWEKLPLGGQQTSAAQEATVCCG
ncbi:hypothetical protein CDD81_95 [Ophiocordyceps australis]|uniref:Copper transport protein n=1 Tax=Ophiocordyceps australis TaxID=1399860 RepID=A0A2C5YK78_9HYPO|nr:hypothetical protein CDD81_95 [Ophiocordyceps australis]